MAITRKDDQELKQMRADYGDKYKGLLENYFALLYLTKKFKVNVDDIARQVAFGSRDYGIDSYYIDRETKNLYLYQFKWSENHNLFKESLERLAKEGMERIFAAKDQDPEQNQILHQLKADLYEHQLFIEKVYIHFVFKGDCEAAENSEGLRERKENLENKKYLAEHFLGRPVPLIVEFISDRRPPPKPHPPDSHAIAIFERSTTQLSGSSYVMHLGFVPLKDLFEIYVTLGQNFLSRNIRVGLSANNPPNRKIREALTDIVVKEAVSPEVFVFNHNGVTLAAEHVDFEDGKARIKVPRLLNGAQTITSVAKFLDDNEGHPALRSSKDLFGKIRVLTKIIVADPHGEFVTNVTICNNQQNPVEPWNLRANDRIQCDLQDKFKEEARIFYSRQENSFENLSDQDRDDMGIEDTQDIRIKQLAQTFLAVQGEIDRISRLRDVFEVQKWYEDTFRESYLRADVRKVVVCYKVGLCLNSAMQKLSEIARQKHAVAVKRARNLVWALLIQAALNDERLPVILENYGTSLKKEADFREYLSTLASSRVMPILKTIFNEDAYAEKIGNENYTFMRTKELFRKCIDVAFETRGWQKKSL